MTHLSFEGDIDNINTRQLEFIGNVLEERGYKDTKVIVEAVGKSGDNYVADVKRIIVGEKFKMIAKIAPTLGVIRMTANTEILFKNEHIMYTEVLPKLVELQKRADVPEEERFRYAICYGSLSEAPNEIILLEDLNESNFNMLDRFQPLTDECVKSVLKNFAVLHSLSYALKHKEPDTYVRFKNSLLDTWSRMEAVEEAQMYFKLLEARTLSILDNDEHKRVVKGLIGKLIPLYAKLARADRDSKHAIIQQGDSWTNNIMFNFNGEKPVQSIMIDYQISKSSSPVCDLLYLIFNCTDYKTRKEYFPDWIEYYHTELDKCLSLFGLKANYVYSKDQLDADLKRYGKTMLALCIMLASILTLKSEEADKMKEAMLSPDLISNMETSVMPEIDGETVSLYKSRVEELIESFLDFGLI